MDRESNNRTIGILYRQRQILKGKEVSEVRGKEGISLGICRVYTL